MLIYVLRVDEYVPSCLMFKGFSHNPSYRRDFAEILEIHRDMLMCPHLELLEHPICLLCVIIVLHLLFAR